MSIDGQFRRKNIKAWVITLVVAAILIGGGTWFLQTLDDRTSQRCRDAGGTPVKVHQWQPVNDTGKPRWQTVIECR